MSEPTSEEKYQYAESLPDLMGFQSDERIPKDIRARLAEVSRALRAEIDTLLQRIVELQDQIVEQEMDGENDVHPYPPGYPPEGKRVSPVPKEEK